MGQELIRCRDGVAQLKLPLKQEFDQNMGVVHGGIVGFIADTAGYFAAVSIVTDGFPTTAELKINLIAPAKQETIIAKGEVVRSGKSLIVCQLVVTGEKDQTIAVGLGTYYILRAAFAGE